MCHQTYHCLSGKHEVDFFDMGSCPKCKREKIFKSIAWIIKVLLISFYVVFTHLRINKLEFINEQRKHNDRLLSLVINELHRRDEHLKKKIDENHNL